MFARNNNKKNCITTNHVLTTLIRRHLSKGYLTFSRTLCNISTSFAFLTQFGTTYWTLSCSNILFNVSFISFSSNLCFALINSFTNLSTSDRHFLHLGSLWAISKYELPISHRFSYSRCSPRFFAFCEVFCYKSPPRRS